MQRFSCLGFLCISHLLILLICDEAEILVAGICDPTIPLTQCKGLVNKTYASDLEGLCDSFLNSRCSDNQSAYWDAFENATNYDNLLGAPAMTDIYRHGNYTYINLMWPDTDTESFVNTSACLPIAVDVDDIIPKVINLTTFANGAFQFSPYSIYLLFNCENLDSLSTMANVAEGSPACQAYQNQCNPAEIMSCVQLSPVRELTLYEVLHDLSCTQFHFLVNNTPWIPSWSTGIVQLVYGGVLCEACFNSSEQCFFDKNTHVFEQCGCGVNHNHFSETVCQHVCKGFSCTKVKIATGVTTAVIAFVLCMMLLFWIYHRKRRYSTKNFPSLSSNRTSSGNHLLTQRAYMLSKKFGPAATKEFSFETLSKATKSFADENMIGEGGFGAVYLGILRDGRKVAVKKLYHDNFRRMDAFYNEIKILSSLDHPHLVKLYGFCCEDSKDLLLVFEYASNGTVFEELHDDTKPAMPWKIRLNIARETAEALAYLHSSKTPPIYHRDVKTTNILLDNDLGVKLADFGLSRLVPLAATHVSTAPQGTPGYLDPDYHQCYQLTDKSDVYSFGVVLVELVSAKLAVDMSRDRREINLSSLALMKIGCGAWEDLVDPRLEMKENPDVEMMVKRVLEIAFMCLNAEKDNRPTMKCVAETLASICNEFGYGFGFDNAFSFRMDINGLSPVHETSHLIETKSKSKSTDSGNSVPSSNWTSSHASSHVFK